MKKTLFAMLGLAMCLASCNKTADVKISVPDPSRPVQFTVSNIYSLETKADAIADGKFAAVYAGSPISVENAKMLVNMSGPASGTLSPAVTNSLLWAVGQTTQATNFLGVYPHENTRPLVKPDDSESNWYINYGIASNDDVDYANIFLSAAASQAPGEDASDPAKVALAFKHPFVKLIYNVENLSDDYVVGLKISGIHRNGHVMFTTGAVTTVGDAVAADAPVVLNANGENSWMTIVMPEELAVNPKVIVEMGSGAKYIYKLSAASVLEAGKVYTAAITVEGGHGETTSDRTVYGTFTVTDWVGVDAGDLTPDGSTAAEKWWYIVGNIDAVDGSTDTNWSKCIPFKCVGPDTWQVDFYYAGTNDDGSTGFKLMHAAPANVPIWDDVWGMGTDTWTIESDTVYPQGDTGHEAHLVHDMASPGNDMKMDIKDQDSRKYRIVFTPASYNFYIYKITE